MDMTLPRKLDRMVRLGDVIEFDHRVKPEDPPRTTQERVLWIQNGTIARTDRMISYVDKKFGRADQVKWENSGFIAAFHEFDYGVRGDKWTILSTTYNKNVTLVAEGPEEWLEWDVEHWDDHPENPEYCENH